MKEMDLASSDTMRPPGRSWRAGWRLGCFGCLLAFLIISGCDWLFGFAFQEARNSHLFTMVSALLALGELLSVMLAGLAGVAWMISPRPRKVELSVEED